MTNLEKARHNVLRENPDLPMTLRFEVSPSETVNRLLSVVDLTLDDEINNKEKNIIGQIYNQILVKLREYRFPNITIIRGNPIVSVEDNFDNLLFSPGNPGRSSTYTRYTDEDHVLRTHTSALVPSTFRKLQNKQNPMTFVFPGLVYRRDVIDPKHLDVFHQLDVWTLQENKTYGTANRKDLLRLAKAIFEAACPGATMIVYEAQHPYTIDGIEVYAEVEGQKIEVLEAGLAHPGVLKKAGIDPQQYSGLALGMGIERLIMARKVLPDIRLIRSADPRIVKQMTNMEKFVSVSNQPAMTRDMSYCVDRNDTEEDICEAIKDAFGENRDLLEQVEVLERTPFQELNSAARNRLGANENQDNILVRITLRHPDKSLTKEQAAILYTEVYPKIHQGTTEGYRVK